MEFNEVVRRRVMVRNYEPREVPADVLQRCLAAARRAPSAGFSQGWEFLVLQGAETEQFWAATAEPGEPDSWLSGMQRAPVIVIPIADKAAYLDRYAEPDKGWTDRDEARWPVPYWLIDTGMASLLILLTAVDEGLGACFFGIPPAVEADVKAAFGIPAELQPIGAISLGYAAPDKKSPSLKRGRREQVVHYGRFGNRHE